MFKVGLYDSLGFAYDGAKQLSRIDYPVGFSVLYQRNAAGQVNEVQLVVGNNPPATFASNLTYLPFGPLRTLTWANGVSLNRSYDQDYRLTEQTVAGWNSQYGYDANSNITQLTSSLLGTLNYSYDALDRLTEEQHASRQQTYGYDAVSNRTSKTTTPIVDGVPQSTTTLTYQYAATSNHLTQIGETPIDSDTAGNLIQDRADRELVYDEQNRLVAVKLSGSTVAEYRYNSLGQRTHKLTTQGTTTFLYGPDGKLLGEQQFDSQGKKTSGQYYLWLDQLPLGGVSVSYDSQGAIASSTPFYLHSDHLNTPRLATDANQQTVWQWTGDAFGVGLASGSLVLNLRFPGQYYDAESGLHYNYFRDYAPQTERYVESDPIGLKGGLNTFGYVLGNPLIFTDPYGLKCVPFKSEYGDTQYICDSGSPYPENLSESGDNSSRGVAFNNPRYNQCYNTCMNQDLPEDVSAACLIPGAGAAAYFRSEKSGAAGGQLCEAAYQSSLCSLECGNLEEARSCPASEQLTQIMSLLLEYLYQSVSYENTTYKFLQPNTYRNATTTIHNSASHSDIKGGIVKSQQQTYTYQKNIRPIIRKEIKQGSTP